MTARQTGSMSASKSEMNVPTAGRKNPVESQQKSCVLYQ
jgi:hypothetical protein